MTVRRGKSLSRSQGFILLGLSIFACICILAGTGVIIFNSSPFFVSRSPTSFPLPPHIVNDFHENNNLVDYFIVVDKSFSKDNAMKLINYYQGQHSGYYILNISFFCDKTYAAEKYLGAALNSEYYVPDSEYYSHMLYWYQTGSPGTRFVVDISNPDLVDYPTLGNACR